MTTPVVAIVTAKPGLEQQLEERFRGVIAATHAEDGCNVYQLNRDTANPRRFVWIEDWESQEHLDRHLATAHIKALFSSFADLVESSEVIVLEHLAGGPA
ncbi:putative quinol monooxygenase [uncultured Massilia sp.]|uniref:putative quinol monooxygenase n=1 Tax=uncultured Massilia sp. TaxID=169973 RepID=UPI0025F0E26E|nr:putative quinol monooxygenase [uncultured Massilia sp.]